MNYVSEVSFDPKVHPLNIAQMMMNIFIFGAVLLGITLLAGILYGFTRVVVKKLFPGQVFDKPKNMEVIRFDLDGKK